MKAAFLRLVFSSVLLSSSFAMAGLHHTLEIVLSPSIKNIYAKDTVEVTPGQSYRFLLNKNLIVYADSAGDNLRMVRAAAAHEVADEYELIAGSDDTQVLLIYSGELFDPIVDNDSNGLISPEGVALFGSTYWLPDFGVKTTYEIRSTTMPSGWMVASPKAQLKIPQPEHYLIAGAFTEYHLETGTAVPMKVFLRSPEPALAQTFFNLLPGYLDHYQQTLGAYPYDSFAVIENFWETGFGMPAFTLLGPGVIRLPYILNSSVPHELLHNWWGNGVFVDYQRGNWCEGLTTYLADHWQQSLTGNSREYRRQSLMNFQDYATNGGADFPLRDFKQRFNFGSQAIGYGKGMMFFHMLKIQLGEAVFAQGLRDLYHQHLGQSISYEEIQKSFEATSGKYLKNYFTQWLDRKGAPHLGLENVRLTPLAGAKYQVSFELTQVSAQSYLLTVPARFVFVDGQVHNELLTLNQARAPFQYTFAKPVRSLEVDPEVDVFRDLDLAERPIGFSNVFGASKVWLTGSEPALVAAYQQSWQNSLANITPTDDKILLDLPREGAVVMLGDNPQYEQLMVQALAGQDFKVSTESLWILGADYPRKDFKTALVARSQTHPGLMLVWIRGAQVETLAPRLLHYGKFSSLAFAEKAVPLKATWPLLKSPLKFEF